MVDMRAVILGWLGRDEALIDDESLIWIEFYTQYVSIVELRR